MLIAGNWKMNTDLTSGTALARDIAEGVEAAGRDLDGVGLAVCPPFVHLHAVGEAIRGSGVALGAQDVHHEDEGAFTGDVSAPMLTSVGCTCVIVGHSERRAYHDESDDDVNAKIRQARAHDLVPILCVGETIEQRRAGDAQAVVHAQLAGGLDGVEINDASALIVAYEPVWAIGTGETATPEQAQEMHAFVRETLASHFGNDVAAEIELLYGGSMKPHNAGELLSQPDVTGGLIGGASLQADSFLGIAHHAAENV
jgi:triosephosphate isomerase